jgi:hypothetical protein
MYQSASKWTVKQFPDCFFSLHEKGHFLHNVIQSEALKVDQRDGLEWMELEGRFVNLVKVVLVLNYPRKTGTTGIIRVRSRSQNVRKTSHQIT